MRKLMLTVIILIMIAIASIGCQQSGLSEDEVRIIVREEVIAELQQQHTTIEQLEAEVAQLKAQYGELTHRVMTLEGEFQLGKVSDTEDIERCLGEIARYSDDLDSYLNDVSAYLDSLYNYLGGWTSYLWMPPSGPPSWSSFRCFKFEQRF